MGPTLQKIERGIYDYWGHQRQPDLQVDRVYLLYLLEGQLEPNHAWHLHIHLVPRFRILKSSMANKVDVLGCRTKGIDAYLIVKLRPGHDVYTLPRKLDRNSTDEARLEVVRGVVNAAGFALKDVARERPHAKRRKRRGG